MIKKTKWYSGLQQPARPGVYERRTAGGTVFYSKWNGKQWMRNETSVFYAENAKTESWLQCIPWRGQVSQ